MKEAKEESKKDLYEQDIDCEYKSMCSSYNTFKCKSCKHNKRRSKKDYYDPDWYPMPWNPKPSPLKPFFPFQPPYEVWCFKEGKRRSRRIRFEY